MAKLSKLVDPSNNIMLMNLGKSWMFAIPALLLASQTLLQPGVSAHKARYLRTHGAMVSSLPIMHSGYGFINAMEDHVHSAAIENVSYKEATTTLNHGKKGDASVKRIERSLNYSHDSGIGFGSADSYGMACGGAIVISANAIVYGNIVTTGAYGTADGSMVFGDIDAVGAVSLGANANFNGTIISQADVSLGANSRLPLGIFTGDIYSAGAVTLGANGKIIGNINSCSAFTQGVLSSITGQVLIGGSGLQIPASNDTTVLDDVTKAYTNLISQTGGKDLEQSIINNVLLPGIYKHIGAWAFGAGRTLTFSGSSSDTWIIQILGAVAFAGDIVLIDGALPSNIRWVVNGAPSIAADRNVYGIIVTSGAISLAAGASIHGSMYSTAGACSLGAGARLYSAKEPTTNTPTKKPITKSPTKKPTTQPPTKKPSTHALTKEPTKKPTTQSPTKKLTVFGSADSYGMVCGGAIVISANAIVYSNIVTTGAYSTADGSMVFGDIDAVGAVSLGANANFNGTIISQAAVSLGANSRSPSGTFTGNIYSAGAVTLGANGKIIGNINACSAFTQGVSSSITGQVLIGGSGLQIPASNDTRVLDDVTKAYTNLISHTGGKDLEQSIINNVLLPGIYKHIGAWAFGAGRTLTFSGSSSDTWIIQILGAVIFAGDIVLIDGALPSNIRWVVNGAPSIAADRNVCGTIVTSGAISLAAGASLNGTMYSTAGACSLGAGARFDSTK